MKDLSAFILAGGKSSRMGRDKAFLELAGQTLLSRALQLARSVAGQVYIVGQKEKFAGYGTIVEDIYAERGPLGGIHAALSASSTELNLLLAVDTPFVTPALLEFVIAEARAGAALVTVPRRGGGFHPLCAVYRRGFAARAREALEAGRNKVDPLFTPADTRILEEAELAARGFAVEIFDNLNTRAEWERAQRIHQ